MEHRLSRVYPNINGFPVSPYELELPSSALDTTRQESWNNHHACFTARKMGEFVMTQTWRDLNSNQYQMPKDIHAILHDRYTPPPLPDITDIMDEIDEAYTRQDPLRYGSANYPAFRVITPTLWRTITNEYTELTI